MKYYLKAPEDRAITGPFEPDEIEAKLKAGELSDDTLATGDIGEGLARIWRAPAEDWLPVKSIPGLGEERPPGPEVAQSGPPPPPLRSVVNAPPSHPSGMAFCPGCGNQLAPGVANTCDRCGRQLILNRPEPIKLLEIKPAGLASKIQTAALKACVLLLQILGGGMLILFLLALLLSAICRK